jgi:hypothetical protein
MPLDPVLDNDDSQPSWQMGLPLRITVHPASPPSPQADNSAGSQGIESDGYPDDWIEPDGYPNDWIVPTDARPAPQGIDNGIAPAKAAAGGSVPYGSIDSDGYPNDWIEPDGYPDDWIVPAGARPAPQGIDNGIAPAKAATGGSVPYGSTESDGYPNDWVEPDGYPDDWIVPGQTRAPGIGFFGTGGPPLPLCLPRSGYRSRDHKPAMAVLTRPDSGNRRRRAWWSGSVTRPRRGQGGFPWGLGRAGNRGRTNSSRACRVSSTIFDRVAERARQVGVMETIAMIGGKEKMRDVSGSCHSGTKDLSERVRRGPASGAISA